MISSSFRWILPRLLAGAAQPGLLAPLERDLAFLRAQGIRHLLTLTEEPLALPPQSQDFSQLHFPVPDMGIPQPRHAAGACAWIEERLQGGEAVLVHCKAGMGRTGVLLACFLVHRGEEAGRAITRVRNSNPGYIQTPAQEAFINSFQAFLGGPGIRIGGIAP